MPSVNDEVLYNSTGEPIAGTSADVDAQNVGFSFTTGSGSSFFSSVALELSAANPSDGGSLTLLLETGPTTSHPLETLGTIQDSSLSTTASLATLASLSPYVLAPDTTYWIEVASTSLLNNGATPASSASFAFESGAAGTGVAGGELNSGPSVNSNSVGAYIAEVQSNVVTPTVDFDTTSQPVAAGPLSLNGLNAVFSYATGAQAGYLSSVTLGLQTSNPGDGGSVDVSLLSSSNGGPGTLVATLGTIQDSSLGTSNTFSTLNVTGSIALAANTQYWIELNGANTSADLNFESGTGGVGTSGQSWGITLGSPKNSDTITGAPIASVQELPVCYCRGAKIATPGGEAAIETLAVGDHVLTASGEGRVVRWIGRRKFHPGQHPRPEAVWPVRVSANAFGQGTPHSDLWLSPGHNIVFEGVLMPISALVNGLSVEQVETHTIEYWHVELESHDILLAQGLPAESYLDTGNRTGFENGGAFIEAYPDFEPKHWAETCLPLVKQGPAVTRARAVLLARLAKTGFEIVEEADAHVVIDGRRIEPTRLADARLSFELPEGGRDISLRSRVFVPAHTVLESEDRRELGLCIGRLEIDGEAVSLEDGVFGAEDWREPEFAVDGRFARRWTAGSVRLPAGVRSVRLNLAGFGKYLFRPNDVAARVA